MKSLLQLLIGDDTNCTYYIWLALNGELIQCWQDYIVLNGEYMSAGSPKAISNNKWAAFNPCAIVQKCKVVNKVVLKYQIPIMAILVILAFAG